METSTYLAQLKAALERRDSTEYTHRPALKAFLESVRPGITATNEPRREECGAPDYVVSRGTGHRALTIGHVEAKDIGVGLDDVGRSEQLRRYLRYLPNLILTDYLEFRWYVDGEFRAAARIARISGDRLTRDRRGEQDLHKLLEAFLDHEPSPIGDPEELAVRMARLTHMIRDIMIEALESERASDTLRDMRTAFARTLIPDLDQPEKLAEFADMYAQTIAYGLFAARCNHRGSEPFRRIGAAAEIPRTNPFLRTLFNTITGPDLDDEPYADFVDDLADVLAHADMAAILERFGTRTRREDPVVHFYETFLAAYDPRLRETRGVYYTPEPVVSYIVRSVDNLLREQFDTEGLADTSTCTYEVDEVDENETPRTETSPRVLILDPACGTGTFLYSVVEEIRQRFMERQDAGMWSGYVKEQLLPRLFGFELLMAPYAVAHFKLGMQLAGQDLPSDSLRQQWAYDVGDDERLGIFLTNTLEVMERVAQQRFAFIERIIAEEGAHAARVKRDLPIMVVLGNPPYSGHSANRSWEVRDGNRVRSFIGRLIQDYHVVDGQPLGERNPKWLQDDYVKFLRWATWRIERSGAGILAFITNHSYLDNPTFRGMRQHLMDTFTDIRILDLHGNAKKRETCPDGSIDENVFDIQQGVAIAIFVKEPQRSGRATVRHADLWGLREAKYACLNESDIDTTDWTTLKPASPHYLFVPHDADLAEEYRLGWKLTDIFRVHSVGIVTARDKLTIQWSPGEMWDVVREFARQPADIARQRFALDPKQASLDRGISLIA